MCKIGKSAFASLRPKHVLLNADMPHNVCGCKYQNNMLLMIECLHKNTNVVPSLHLKEFADLCICNKSDKNFARNECRACKDGPLFDKMMLLWPVVLNPVTLPQVLRLSSVTVAMMLWPVTQPQMLRLLFRIFTVDLALGVGRVGMHYNQTFHFVIPS